MKEVRDIVKGDLTISNESYKIHGTVAGNLIIGQGADVQLSGTVTGDAIVQAGYLIVSGTVHGDVINRGGRLEVYGTVYGDVRQESGTTRIDPNAVINHKKF